MLYNTICCILLVIHCNAKEPLAETLDGKIQGSIQTSYGGRKYMQFLGIPYASPPVGELRFEDPLPVKPWNTVMIANSTSICLQLLHSENGGYPQGTEDCLHLNVYVPGRRIKPRRKLGVIVDIHGGAFMFGEGLSAGPKFTMDRDVIQVNINYRVGPFGFLSTGDSNLPGNFGMKDQVMALHWIQKNIGYFGGNKDSVMIIGSSAGGASVQHHYLSPLSRGLFQRGISQSGCVLNAWVLQEEPLKSTKIIGNAVGCSQENTQELVACLKLQPSSTINEAVRLLRTWFFDPFSPLALVVDKYSKNPFLPDHPYRMLLEGKVYDVPWMMGVITNEGLYPGAGYVMKDEYLIQLRDHWEEYIPYILHYVETIPEDLKPLVARKIKEFYLGNREVGFNTFKEIVQLIGDRLFVADMEKAVRLHSAAVRSQVYFYQFNYTMEERLQMATFLTGNLKTYGAGHGDDSFLIFSYSRNDSLAMSPNDEIMKEAMLDMCMSFMKTGIPKPDNWLPVLKNIRRRVRYMHIGTDGKFKMRSALELGHRSFWESLSFEENENLFEFVEIKNLKTK